MSEDIIQKLDRLANFQAQIQVLELDKQALIDRVLTPEIRIRLDEIEAEFADKLEAVEENIATLEAEIRAEVIRHGTTVKGTFLQASFYDGRVSWDTKALDRYAKSHPEIIGYRKQGQPYTSIKKI